MNRSAEGSLLLLCCWVWAVPVFYAFFFFYSTCYLLQLLLYHHCYLEPTATPI